MKRTLRNSIKYHIKLWKDGKLIVDTYSRKKRKIQYTIREIKFSRAYLRVIYKPKLYNDGYFTCYRLLNRALSSFTEKSLVKYINGEQL